MTCLVQDAITARLPLVTVISQDPFYDTAIIRNMTTVAQRFSPSNHITQNAKQLSDLLMGKTNGTKQGNAAGNKVICYTGNLEEPAWKDVYETALEKKSTVVILLRNGEEFKLGYQAGVLNPPSDMIFESLKAHCEDIFIPEAQKALQGLQLSDIDSVLRLTKTRDEKVTASGIRETRKAFVGGVRGLKLVEVSQPYYKPDEAVREWLTINANPFLKATMQRLIPRGLMFAGVAGTGKTAGAKYLAQQLEVQLVRVDMASMLSKWQGDAEMYLDHALATLDQMSPCVALFDEIEKVIANGEDNGTNARMLSKLLWWLQEKTSKVLVVMTTNKLNDLPQELYREGRVDEVLTLDGLKYTPDALQNFVDGLAEPFVKEGLQVPTIDAMEMAMGKMRYEVVDMKKKRDPNGTYMAQAEITGAFIKRVKILNYIGG